MKTLYICDTLRTLIGRRSAVLSSVLTNELGGVSQQASTVHNPSSNWPAVDGVQHRRTNQVDEDDRNEARIALLLSGLWSSWSRG